MQYLRAWESIFYKKKSNNMFPFRSSTTPLREQQNNLWEFFFYQSLMAASSCHLLGSLFFLILLLLVRIPLTRYLYRLNLKAYGSDTAIFGIGCLPISQYIPGSSCRTSRLLLLSRTYIANSAQTPFFPRTPPTTPNPRRQRQCLK